MAEWIDLLDPNLDELRAKLPADVHQDAIQRMLAPTVHDDEPRPRFEGRHTHVFGILLAPVCIEGAVHFREVDLIVTRDLLITVRKTPEQGPPIEFELGPADRAGELAAAATGRRSAFARD